MFIVAAAAFLFLHAAFAAFIIVVAVKLYTGFLPHAVMYLHGNARRNPEVYKSQYGNNHLFHYSTKVNPFIEQKA